MSTSYVERELKFDVEPDFVVPDLASFLPAGGRTESSSQQLRSEYFDTADRSLLRAHMTLRRRTGTADNGWQLKVPHAAFREEIRVELGDGGVPDELQQLLLGVGRKQPLVPIASVITERSVTTLLDGEGRKLAEIDDDTVHASAVGESATATRWREVEIELGDDEVELLYALGKQLRRAGARSSSATSKLARALPGAPQETKDARKQRAGDIVGAYVDEQRRTILAGDLALRRGDESVIHPTRVATRRLRSALRVFGPLYEPQAATALDAELQWLASLLGEVRDRQVMRDRLDTLVAAVDETLLLGPVRARVDTELSRDQAQHWKALQQELAGTRYFALLDALDGFVEQPPFTDHATAPARSLEPLVRSAQRRVSQELARGNKTGDIHRLHAARKAAKRARYAAEAAQPVIGSSVAKVQAKRYQELQDLLGDHQDSLVSAELLRRLGAKAGTTRGENGFAFGIMHEREAQHARRVRKNAKRVAKRYR